MSKGLEDTLPIVGREPSSPAIGRLVARRYRLERLIGIGGYGKVWRARDEVAGDLVAVKILRQVAGEEAARTRREIAALRMLRIPGVARLLDEGIDDGETFIVMDLVSGSPFPGAEKIEWEVLEPRAIELLQTLGRMHAEGVVHRDLKPDNILVDESGHPTILDFGIATIAFSADRLTEEGFRIGTPAYLAPEQVRGERATSASDLYAVGVIFYRALSGKWPHDVDNAQQMLAARLTVPPRSLATVAPSVPPHAAATIDSLLRRDADDRPRSAADVVSALRRTHGQDEMLPCAGRAPLIERIVATLAAGKPFLLAGGPGMGKTRVVHEVARALETSGRVVHRIRPEVGPYSALGPIVGSLDEWRDAPLEHVDRELHARLVAAFAGGAVLVVDDADRLDKPSARLLASLEEGAPVLSTSSSRTRGRRRADATLDPLTAADMEERLFAGSNRVFHLREDAANELLRRTNGVPARIEKETRAWMRAGLAQRLPDGRLLLDRSALARLTTDLVALPADVLQPSRSRTLTEPLDELLAWIELADGAADPGMLAELTGRPAWEIDADLLDLVDTGACGLVPQRRLVALEGSSRLGLWSLTERGAAHRRLAHVMPAGAPGRLRHLVLSRTEDRLNVVRESLQLAEKWAAEGLLERAAVALEGGLALARSFLPIPTAEVLALGSLWVAVALFDGSTSAIDRVLYELQRWPGVDGLAPMIELARAALAVRSSSAGSSDLADAVTPLDDPRLDRLRLATRMLAARRRELPEEERVLEELKAWAETRPSDTFLRASISGQEGKVRLRQGRFSESVRAHLESARGAEWPGERIGANLNAAAAALEDFDLEGALAMATRARTEAAACRHAYLECRAEYFTRVALYRLERPLEVDGELVQVAGRVARDLEALCTLQEAAIAWRRGDRAIAGALANDAATVWRSGGEAPGWVLAEALALACGAAGDRTLQVVKDRLDGRAPSRIVAQAVALLAGAGLCSVDAQRIESLVATVPRESWGRRLAVISMDECRRLLGAA